MLFASLSVNCPGTALGGFLITARGGPPPGARAKMKSAALGGSYSVTVDVRP